MCWFFEKSFTFRGPGCNHSLLWSEEVPRRCWVDGCGTLTTESFPRGHLWNSYLPLPQIYGFHVGEYSIPMEHLGWDLWSTLHLTDFSESNCRCFYIMGGRGGLLEGKVALTKAFGKGFTSCGFRGHLWGTLRTWCKKSLNKNHRPPSPKMSQTYFNSQ